MPMLSVFVYCSMYVGLSTLSCIALQSGVDRDDLKLIACGVAGLHLCTWLWAFLIKSQGMLWGVAVADLALSASLCIAAVFLFQEHMTTARWLGMACALLAMLLFSFPTTQGVISDA